MKILKFDRKFRPPSEKLCRGTTFSKVNGFTRYSIRNSRKDIQNWGLVSEISTFTTEFEKTKRMCSKTLFSCAPTCGAFPSDFVLLKEQNSLLFSYVRETSGGTYLRCSYERFRAHFLEFHKIRSKTRYL